MLQIAFMILGIVYVFKLIGLGRAGADLGLPWDVLEDWKSERKKQYIWGIVAGWGSFLVTIMAAQTTPTGYYTAEEAFDAMLPSLLLGVAVLIVGIVLSVLAGRKAKAIEQRRWSPPVGPPN